MVKVVSLLLALPVASAFVAPLTPRAAPRGRALQMNFGYEEGGRPVGGVQFFPDSEKFWDPLGFTKDKDADWIWRLQNGEIKNGRVAMLACIDYLVKGLGFRFPFEAGGINTAEIPGGLGSIKALPLFGFWLPFFFLCGALDISTDGNAGNPGFKGWQGGVPPNRVPGNVQPATDGFAAPGDPEIRTKEINNGRMAMISIFGIWAGELLTGGQQPFDTLNDKFGIHIGF